MKFYVCLNARDRERWRGARWEKGGTRREWVIDSLMHKCVANTGDSIHKSCTYGCISVYNPQTRRRDVDFVPQLSIIYIGAIFDLMPGDWILSLRGKRITHYSKHDNANTVKKNFICNIFKNYLFFYLKKEFFKLLNYWMYLQ